MTVKIAVTGTHSTGKTTFVEMVTDNLRASGHRVAVVSDLGAEALRRGFPILQQHSPQSTLWIMATGIARELEASLSADVVLVDRPVPDALGYYRAALVYRNEIAPPGWAAYLETVASHHSATYDLVFSTQLDPTIPVGRNKPRDPDNSFRSLAATAITEILDRMGIDCEQLTSTNHEMAVRTVVDHVARHAGAVPAIAAPRTIRPA